MNLETITQLPSYRGKVPSTALNMLPNIAEGDIVITSDLCPPKSLIFKGGAWKELSENGINTNISLYSINKSAVAKGKSVPVTKERKKITKLLEKYLTKFSDEFFLLYGKEISYFTLFHRVDDSEFSFVDEFINSLNNLGTIYTIDEWQDTLEVWMKTTEEPATVLYLFPYDQGIVEVKK